MQWVVGIGSSLLVLALLGFVVSLVIEGTNRPPVIQVRVERVLEVRNGYVVEVGVYNEGGDHCGGAAKHPDTGRLQSFKPTQPLWQ